MKRLIIVSIVLAITVGTVFAAPGSEGAAEVVELNWLHRAGARVDQWQRVADAFNESQSRILVEVQHVAEGYNELLQTQFLADDGPDIFTHKGAEIPQLVEAGWILDISNEPFTKRVDPAALTVFSHNGGVYAFPFESKGWGLWVNNDMLDVVGAKAPKTIDEFIELCEVSKSQGQEPVATGYAAAWFIGQSITYGVTSFIVPWIQENRDAYDSGNFTFNTPEFRDFYQMIAAIKKYAPAQAADMDADAAVAAFAEGKFPMLLAGEWSVGAVRKMNTALNATVHPLPVSNNPDDTFFPASYGEVEFNVDIDKAAMREFMDFWFDDGPIMKEYFESVGLAPLIMNYTVDINIDPLTDETVWLTKTGRSLPTYQYFDPPGSRGVVWSEVQGFFLDKDQTVDDLIKTLDSIWKEYWEAAQ
jgi:ABC-type glycerol-3-phosphate transport system substrate-binding protein